MSSCRDEGLIVTLSRCPDLSRCHEEMGLTSAGDVLFPAAGCLCNTSPVMCHVTTSHVTHPVTHLWHSVTGAQLLLPKYPPPQGISRQKYFICPITSSPLSVCTDQPASLKCYSAIVDGTFQSNIVYQIEHLIFDIWVRTQSDIWNCSFREEREIVNLSSLWIPVIPTKVACWTHVQSEWGK